MGRGPRGAFRSHVGSKLLFDVLSLEKPGKMQALERRRHEQPKGKEA